MNELIEKLQETGVLVTPHIIDAFKQIDRRDFVFPQDVPYAHNDIALPIVGAQTISQPTTVAFALEKLQPQPGDRVLDIGSGSGWQTALLAHIVGDTGSVFAMELVPEVKQFGEKNIKKYEHIRNRVHSFLQNAEQGLHEHAPFDRIVAAASVEAIPPAWIAQLKPNGHLVTPVGDTIELLKKDAQGAIETKTFQGFVFVPFITNSDQRHLR